MPELINNGSSNGNHAYGTTLIDVTAAPYQAVSPVPASRDAVAVHYCKTLRQIRESRQSFDVVVVGGGAVGCAVANEILNRSKTSQRRVRVLLLEKGSFLLPEHVQNLDPRYQPLIGKATARPWRVTSRTEFDLAPQIPYLGGRALFWSTWIPRPTPEQMRDWPAIVLKELKEQGYWDHADRFLGAVKPSDMGPEFTTFQPYLLKTLFDKFKDGNFTPFLKYTDHADLEIKLASRATSSSRLPQVQPHTGAAG